MKYLRFSVILRKDNQNASQCKINSKACHDIGVVCHDEMP